MKTYFAYGSNLWRQQMQIRCPEHLLLGAGILMGYRIIITANGYASIVKSVPDLVFGTVYAISASDESRLDFYEGVSGGLYRKEMVEVETARGAITCLIYIDPVQEEGAPKEEYVQRVRMGIMDAQLPSIYVDRYLWQLVAQ